MSFELVSRPGTPMTNRHRFLSSVTPSALLNAAHGLLHASTARPPVSVNPELSVLTVREGPPASSRGSATEAQTSTDSNDPQARQRRVLSVRAFTADPHYPTPAGAGLSVTVRTSDGGTGRLTLRAQDAAADGGRTPRRGFRGELTFRSMAPTLGRSELSVPEGGLITVEYRQPDGSILIASVSR